MKKTLVVSVIILLCGLACPAQTVAQLGTAADNCPGSIAFPNPALRYGFSFTCIFSGIAPGMYTVSLSFQEPTYSVIGKRVMNISVNGWPDPLLQGIDIVSAGTTPTTGPITRTVSVPLISADGAIRVQLTTAVPGVNAVLAAVIITPVPFVGLQGLPGVQGVPGPSGPAITGQPCVAAGSPAQMAKLPDGTCLPVVTINPVAVNASPSIDRIAGPVIQGASPWPWYDAAENGNVHDIGDTGLAHLPILGAKAAGTFELKDGCTITLTGPGAAEFHNNDNAVVAWEGSDGPGTGRLAFQINTAEATVLHSQTMCGLPVGIPAQAGLSVYHCDSCYGDTPVLPFASWGPYSGGNTWSYYDVGAAMYLYAKRTGAAVDMQRFRSWTDAWWVWFLNQGGTALNPPRGAGLLSQFERALDGRPERFAPIYNAIEWWRKAAVPSMAPGPGWDSRETGYVLMWYALGALADPDQTRHASYCSTLAGFMPQALAGQSTAGYWPDKSFNYPYRAGGTAPWRQFAVFRALAHSYDAFEDTTAAGCNNPALATSILNALQKAGDFVRTYPMASNGGSYYDLNYPNNGQIWKTGTGTVSASLTSAGVVGVGTKFSTEVKALQYVGMPDRYGNVWSSQVKSIEDETHLTMVNNWADGGAGMGPDTDVTAVFFDITDPAPTNCNGVASSCYTGVPDSPDGTVAGDRVEDEDFPWLLGWLYKTTGAQKWKTAGDLFFGKAYGGPAGGPGTTGPCAGPNCDGQFSIAYQYSIHGCVFTPALPCDSADNFGPLPWNNALNVRGKYFGQGSGIGSADNYLAWRLLSAKP